MAADENVYPVWLVFGEGRYGVSGFFVYRGDQLPEEGETIPIEPVADPSAVRFYDALAVSGLVSTGRAYVTHVRPDDKIPIIANEVQPES
jgi:hypothetical protein